MKKNTGNILIAIGIIIIIIPLIGRIRAQSQQDELMNSFLEDSSLVAEEERINALNENLDWGNSESNQDELNLGVDSAVAIIDEYNGEASEDASNVEEGGRIKQKPKAIGIMEIEKINVKLPIAEGTDLATLKFALGHMPETAAIGDVGNCVIAGHRSHSAGVFFNRLDEVAIDDTIKVTTKGGEYTYRVYEILVVEPDDTSVLRGTNDNKVMTLITCTPVMTATHRLIVHAVLVE